MSSDAVHSDEPLARFERPAPDGSPAGMLVLLHGRGADGRDLFPLLDILDPDAHPVIVAQFGHDARERLTDAGANVEWREPPIGHELDPATIVRARQLIAELLPA